jgi:hypothetical protein
MGERKKDTQINAHETMPHRPPATSTASGLEWVPSPPNVVSSCLLLSYVIKYVAVPSVSRTIVPVSITSVSMPEEKGGTHSGVT